MTFKAKKLGEEGVFPSNCGQNRLNKREFFAGLAMQSCISMSKIDPYNAAKIPSLSVVFADALLEELVKEN